MQVRREPSPDRDFIIAIGITVLVGAAIFSAPGPTFPVLHTILNTGIAVATGVVALLFWDLGWRTRETLVRLMGIVYAVVGFLELLHVLAALEPSTASPWLNHIHQGLRSGTWGPPAYLLPFGVGFILLVATRRRMSKSLFAACIIAVAAGLFALFQWMPRYVDTGFLGILRPTLLPLPVLWIPLGVYFWRRRHGHPISHALAYYALGTALSHLLMLWSSEATSKFAMTAHFGVFAFGLYLLLTLMQMGTLNMERRRRIERELLSHKLDLETRVAARTAELEALNADLRREIGVRHTAEVRTLMQVERLELLRQVTRAIAERHDLASIFQVVVRSIEEDLPADFAAMCNYQKEPPLFAVSRIGARSEQLALELTEEESSIEVGANGLSRCLTGQLVYEPDVSRVQAPFAQRLTGAGMRSMVLVPLSAEPDGVFAVLVAARRAIDAFSSAECEFLRQLCDHVALAARHAQLHASLQQAYEELQRTQSAVLEHERLRALGQMASGIAHDINNAISPAAVYVDSILERETGFSDRTRKQLEIVRRAVDDVARTVARMGEFYRKKPEKLELAAVPVDRVLNEVLELTRARWSNMAQQRGAFIDTRIENTAGNPLVMAIESELREALINLVLNAIDAMPEGGKLVLRSGIAREDGKTAGRVFIEISDTGVGMDEETRRRCLEPFFTTKGERGSGLGLPMVYGIAQRHDVEIDIRSAPGSGTTFRMTFPPFSPARPKAVVEPRVPRNTRILLVDDDPVLLASLSDVLVSEGHEVHTAAGGQEGIDAFRDAREAGRPFPVVLTDLGMPYVDGRAVAAAIVALVPGTPVIMLTGWGQRLLASEDIPAHVIAVLGKPPNLVELRRKLAECVGDSVPPK